MLTIHHLGVSQSDRIVWLCEELGIPYDLKLYARDPDARGAPEDYKALHPAQTAPVIDDDDVRLAESGAIIDYLIGKHGGGALKPVYGDADFADFCFWYHFSNGSFMPRAMIQMIMKMTGSPAAGFFDARADAAFAMVEARLGETPWIAGDRFTAADIMIAFPLTTMRSFLPRDMSGFPNILAYLQRVAARPAFATAMAKADPGMAIKLD